MQDEKMKNLVPEAYWVCLLARDAAAHLESTLDSLLGQTSRPLAIVVVDDGSTDQTSVMLANYRKQHPNVVRILALPDKGYDIRRVPRNVNLAWHFATHSGLDTEYFMISGDDCSYPKQYAQTLISRMMSQPRVAVSSGHPRSKRYLSEEHSPSGSGRMIKSSFWKTVGGRYPIRAGWETWLLYKAQEKGAAVKLFDDLNFEHVRPRGTIHQFTYWGAAMHVLGYHPLYAFGRIARNLIKRKVPIGGSLNMLRGYVQGCLDPSDPYFSPLESSLREFVSIQQKRQMASITRAIAKAVIA
jgi:glycosyltransferase involved in cell wall biosynthesis